MPSAELWAGIGSVLAFILGVFSMTLNYHETITLWMNKIQDFFSPYVQITIPEHGTDPVERSDFYVAIQAYLSDHCTTKVHKLKAEVGSHRKRPLFYVDDGQQITDKFRHGGFSYKVWWHGYKEKPAANINYRPGEEVRRFYRVSFHGRFHGSVLMEYLPQVIEKGRDVIAKHRQRCIFTNNPDSSWSQVASEHLAIFNTLAMDPTLKQTIMDDLKAFKLGNDYFAKVGKPWKRGYLLFGPPHTGNKSTMVAAMASYLEYDIYDLELTAVKSNNDLRRLFIHTTGKSIIVIDGIDHSVDLTGGGRRVDKNNHPNTKLINTPPPMMVEDDINKDGNKQLTISGLLEFIDGLWSACCGERIIVFTTNNKDKLDPALIGPGRMDMHIEMSYCSYEAFKVLAKNYLGIDDHQLFERFGEIQTLLGEAKISPADVAEHLMRTDKDAVLTRTYLILLQYIE